MDKPPNWTRLELTGPQRRQVHAALIAAFPNAGALSRLVAFGLNEHLPIVAGEGDLATVAFNLITWAEARGRLGDLLTAAQVENPNNSAFRRLMADLEKSQLGNRLLSLLDTHPSTTQVRTFLAANPIAIAKLCSVYEDSISVGPTVGPATPDFCAIRGAGYVTLEEWRVVFLAPADEPAFGGSPTPSPTIAAAVTQFEALRVWLQSPHNRRMVQQSPMWSEPDRAVEVLCYILAGRRSQVTTAEAQHRLDYTTAHAKVEIRTYDALVDALRGRDP